MATSSRRGFSLRIFVPEGTPDGLRVVEKTNWTGCGLVCPRSRFKDVKGRREFARTGLYVLFGPSEDGDLPTVYIGEGDPALPRLERHIGEKDFWTSLILFTSKDDNLNKAHVQYLEARLYLLARDANRCILDNVVTPQPPSLSEADREEMEGFLDEMLLIYPLLGLGVFEKPEPSKAATRMYTLRGRGIEASGYEASDGFVVLAGSQVAKDVVASAQGYLQTIRTTLQGRGVISLNGTELKVTQDYTFNSPSTAAGVLLGRSINGREAWKDESGKTLKENQLDAMEDNPPP